MSSNPLKNIPLKTFRDFLTWRGLKHIRTTGGHEVWSTKELSRPVIIQTHISPIPLHVVKNIFRTIDCTTEDYIEFLKN